MYSFHITLSTDVSVMYVNETQNLEDVCSLFKGQLKTKSKNRSLLITEFTEYCTNSKKKKKKS